MSKNNEINVQALKFCGFTDSDTPIIDRLIEGVISLLKTNKIITEAQSKNLDDFLLKSDNYFKFYYIALALWKLSPV